MKKSPRLFEMLISWLRQAGKRISSLKCVDFRCTDLSRIGANISNLKHSDLRFLVFLCLLLVVNATPLGMSGYPGLQFDVTVLPLHATVFDMVTAPIETEFLRSAQRRGLAAIDGLTMLAEQGAMAFAAFFNAGPERADTPALRRLLTA